MGWPLFCFDSERRDALTAEPVIIRNGKVQDRSTLTVTGVDRRQAEPAQLTWLDK